MHAGGGDREGWQGGAGRYRPHPEPERPRVQRPRVLQPQGMRFHQGEQFPAPQFNPNYAFRTTEVHPIYGPPMPTAPLQYRCLLMDAHVHGNGLNPMCRHCLDGAVRVHYEYFCRLIHSLPIYAYPWAYATPPFYPAVPQPQQHQQAQFAARAENAEAINQANSSAGPSAIPNSAFRRYNRDIPADYAYQAYPAQDSNVAVAAHAANVALINNGTSGVNVAHGAYTIDRRNDAGTGPVADAHAYEADAEADSDGEAQSGASNDVEIKNEAGPENRNESANRYYSADYANRALTSSGSHVAYPYVPASHIQQEAETARRLADLRNGFRPRSPIPPMSSSNPHQRRSHGKRGKRQ